MPLIVIFAIHIFFISINLAVANTGVSERAPDVVFYVGLTEPCCGEDSHPVHGMQTADGGYVLVGKSADSSGNSDGFIVKLQPDNWQGTFMISTAQFSQSAWVQTMGTRGYMDGLNNVAATDSAIFAAGFVHANDGTIDRYLAKHNISTGTRIWEAVLSDPITGRDGAIESIVVTRTGGLIVTGVINAHSGTLEGFKSYGNSVDGQAYLAYFSTAQLDANHPPAAPMWLTLLPESVSGKAVREVNDVVGGYVVAARSIDEGPARVIRISPNGQIAWSKIYPDHGEVTDIAILRVGTQATGFALTGHRGGYQEGIDGSVTYLNLKGDVCHHKTVGNPLGGIGQFSGLDAGNPKLIFDECWGIHATTDGGVVVACGTGIEGCDAWRLGSAIRKQCDRDLRITWRSLIVKLNADGDRIWHRVDSFLEEAEEKAPDTAAEYVSFTHEGAVIATIDQGFGIGLMVLESN